MLTPDSTNMTFSALQRYVRIHQGIMNSSALLSVQDASDLFHLIIDQPKLWTSEEIEEQCKEMQDARSGENMVSSGVLRYAGL